MEKLRNPPQKQPRTANQVLCGLNAYVLKKIKLDSKLSPPSQNPPEKQPRTTHREPSAMWPKCLCVKKNKIRFKIIPTKSKSTAETIANHAPRTANQVLCDLNAYVLKK